MPGLPALQRPFADLSPLDSFKLGERADWVEITEEGVWIGASGPNSVHRISPKSHQHELFVELPGNACSGLASGFGSLWIPLCADKPGLARVDLKTGQLSAVLPIGPAMKEGSITTSPDSVWLVTDSKGSLVRVDPASGSIRQTVQLPAGSYNPLYYQGVIWVTSVEQNLLTMVDATDGHVIGSVATGPNPRFLTGGGGAVWTLNQGDGSLTKIDAASHRRVADIPLGLPGPGGDIAFDRDKIWVTMSGIPLTEIDAKTDQPLHQWVGPGGDSLRVSQGIVWLTNFRDGTVASYKP